MAAMADRLAAASCGAYRRLLVLYPRAHRREYDHWMLQLYGDMVRDALATGGVWGLLALWWRTLGDLGASLVAEHSHLALSGHWLGRRKYRRAPWWQVGLAALPGLARLLCDRTVCGALFLVVPPPWLRDAAPAALAAAIVAFDLVQNRRVSTWSLPSLGMSVATLPETYGLALRLITGKTPAGQPAGPILALLLAVGVTVGLMALGRRLMELDMSRWALTALGILVSALLLALLLPPARPALGMAMVLLVGVGTLTLGVLALAPERGARALLLLLAPLEILLIEGIMDPGYGLPLWTRDWDLMLVVHALPPLMTLVLAPLAMLRVCTAQGQAIGLALAAFLGPGLAVLLAHAVHPYAPSLAVSFLGVLPLPLMLAFAAGLCDAVERSAQADWVL